MKANCRYLGHTVSSVSGLKAGARGQGGKGAREQGSKGAREQGSKGVRGQGLEAGAREDLVNTTLCDLCVLGDMFPTSPTGYVL